MRSKALLISIALAAIAAAPADAQPSDPGAVLVAPRDALDYRRRSEAAAQLVDEERWFEAETALRALTSDYPIESAASPSGSNWGRLARALREQGKHRETIAAYERVIALQGPGLPYPGSSAWYWIAASHAALGENEAALAALDTLVFREGYLRRPELFDDANFARLREEPRFATIAGREDVSGLSRDEGWRRDIDYLTAELARVNPGGGPPPEAFGRLAEALKTDVPRIGDEQVVIGLGRMLDSLGRGHTGFFYGAAPSRVAFDRLPVRFWLFPEGLFVTEGLEGHEDLAGAQVLRFGDTPAEEALALIAGAQSNESAAEAAWLTPHLIAHPALLSGLGVIPPGDSVTLTLRMRDGSTVERTLTAVPPLPPAKLNAPPGVAAPLFLRNAGEAHWFEAMPEQGAIYVQVNNIFADPDETMEQFGARLRGAIAERDPRAIILDLRHNNGGNSFTYVELLRTLTAFSTREGRRVYALIGRNVYSAAANFTTDLERLVRPVFIGEPTSQTGNQWGDESFFTLPWSGLVGALAGARWQLSHPWDERRSIAPHVPVQLTAEAYFAGRDPVLEAALAMIAEQHR